MALISSFEWYVFYIYIFRSAQNDKAHIGSYLKSFVCHSVTK